MIFPNWKQRAVDKAQRQQSGQTTMRISRVTLQLLAKLRGNVEASDDETVYYAAAQSIRDSAAASVAANASRSLTNDSDRIRQAPTRPVNASDADRLRLPSEREGS